MTKDDNIAHDVLRNIEMRSEDDGEDGKVRKEENEMKFFRGAGTLILEFPSFDRFKRCCFSPASASAPVTYARLELLGSHYLENQLMILFKRLEHEAAVGGDDDHRF